MRKNVFGRQLKRDINERKALFKGLISSLVLYGKIETTEEKAKSVKGQVDKLVTRVKKNSKNVSSDLALYLNSEAIKKLVSTITRFNGRNGGYTRIVKLGRRLNDNAKMVLMDWVDKDIEDTQLKTEHKEEEKEERKASSKKKEVKREEKTK